MSIFGTITATMHDAADVAAALEFGAERTIHRFIIECR
jgi:hypothetical protein